MWTLLYLYLRGTYGFSIIRVWLSPSDLWLYLRERPFYPWLLMAYKKITSPTKCPLLIAFQSCLGAVWVWSLVDHECVCLCVWCFGPGSEALLGRPRWDKAWGVEGICAGCAHEGGVC